MSSSHLGAASPGRILMLLENNAYPGDTRVRREALALVDAGFEVTVIAPREVDQPVMETVQGVRVYRYAAPVEHDSVLGFAWEYIYSTLAALFMAFRVWQKEGFDAIHAHSPPDTLFVVGAIFKLFGKKYVFDHHDLSPELYMVRSGGKGNALLHRLLLLFEWLTFRCADHVIATNNSYRDIALSRGGKKPSEVTVVRNGPPRTAMGFDQPHPDLAQTDRVIFGYVGEISVQDGLAYLVEALDHLKNGLGREDFLCIVMGDGADLARIKSLVREKGLDRFVQFTGWLEREELGQYLASIDIGVDPDPSNPFNDRCTMIKMAEYMAYSKPIVAFDLPEHRYTAGESALYVPDNSVTLFAEALETLMDDPEKRKEMGRYARDRVETELAWEYSVPHLVNGYYRLFGHDALIEEPISREASSLKIEGV